MTSAAQWRESKRDHVSHAFHDGRRYSYCGQAERIRERDWLFSTPKAQSICLRCIRVDRMPPRLTLSDLLEAP